MRTTAVAKGGGSDLLLSGSKTFITNGSMADLVIVACKTDPAAKGSKVRLYSSWAVARVEMPDLSMQLGLL